MNDLTNRSGPRGEPHPPQGGHTVSAAERFIWAIAAFKLLKGTLLVLVACGAFRLLREDREAAILHFVQHFRGDPDNRHIHALLERMLGISRHQLEAIGFGTLFYALLFYIEGIGLLLRKTWAEWMTVITGAAFIPLEIWEVIHKPHWIRMVVLLINVLIVGYLVWILKRKKRARVEINAPSLSDAGV